MQHINLYDDFYAAIHVERAIIFVFFDWSAGAALSHQTFHQWERLSPPGTMNCHVYQLNPDHLPVTWKWLATAIPSVEADAHAQGSVLWVCKGVVVGFAQNASLAGPKTLTQITHDCFVLGKTGVTSASIHAEPRPFDASLLEILCCPETHQNLALAAPAALEKLNRQISGGQVKNRAGQPVAGKIDAGLVRADGKFLYPLRQNIPILLVDEAIPLAG